MIILEKSLSKTDISRRLAVPMEYFNMEQFPKPGASLEGNPREDFVVKDEKGRVWNLSCSIRKQPNHPKPVLINEWIHFVQSKKLREGDRVIIYGEQDEIGLMQLRIKAEKCTGSYEAPCFPFMNQNPDRYKGLSSHSSSSESTATFQPSETEDHSAEYLLADVLNHELNQITATTTPSINKEHIPTNHSTSQDIARHKTKGPRLNPSLELTLKPATTEGMTAATSSSIDKNLAPTFHSHSQDIGTYNTETPNLSLNLGLTLKPTYMQDTTHK
ncbi:hypothetical protein ERO13_A01G200500v2 [Gossypium hirsutum]|nr:hypothetical protein ERO13_A01G200500v2 [Gossypium hirsutum]